MADNAVELDRSLLEEATRVCACFAFRKATRAVTQLFDTILQPSGLRSTQLVMLITVVLQEPITIARLARELVVDRTTLTRNLNPLEKAGYIRVAAGKDRRTKLITATPRGRQALAEAVPYWSEAQQRFVAAIGQERFNDLLANLNRVVSVTRDI